KLLNTDISTMAMTTQRIRFFAMSLTAYASSVADARGLMQNLECRTGAPPTAWLLWAVSVRW
ncbi:hypothetical protein, partial [uncultured Thiohalocapsa sp.]|uniref:hypothetical protein n=1 Tax=uncultured Thiohalocapsa sp. TaxID=768990 RepID=UPI0025D41E16